MADSPAIRGPIDPKEQPILDSLLRIRDNLLLLKSDKSQYVKSQDVIEQYDKVLEQIANLNDIRKTKPDEENRLDTVLDDCLQLISLFFLTIGRNNEAPAAYSVSSTIKRLLDHLKEAGFFSGKDLSGLAAQLDKIQDSVTRGQNRHSPAILQLLQTRVTNSKAELKELQQTLSGLSPELTPTHEKLVSVLRTLSGLNLKPKFPTKEVEEYQKHLHEIEASLEGQPKALPHSERSAEEQYVERLRHMSYDDSAIMDGRDLVVDLLGRVMLWSEIMLHRQGKIQERFRDTFQNLLNIYKQLEKLSLTQAWSLRETDLYGYQRRLDRIDESRVDGNFLDGQGKPAEIFEQRAMLYVVRKCYAMIYFMITSSEPVSEALLPIYNQLSTLKRCLIEVKKSGGVNSPRELYPYSMKLNSIDNMRKDGKFMVNGEVPEGQGSVTALLSECFDLAYELRTDAEGNEENSDDNDEDNDDRHSGGTKGDTRDHESRGHRDLGNDEEDDEPTSRIEKAMKDHSLISGTGPAGETSRGMSALSLGAN